MPPKHIYTSPVTLYPRVLICSSPPSRSPLYFPCPPLPGATGPWPPVPSGALTWALSPNTGAWHPHEGRSTVSPWST